MVADRAEMQLLDRASGAVRFLPLLIYVRSRVWGRFIAFRQISQFCNTSSTPAPSLDG